MDRIFDVDNLFDINAHPDPTKCYRCSFTRTSSGFTYLMKLVLSAKYNTEHKIKEILRCNPKEINKKNENGWTSLILACMNASTVSSVEIIKILLECEVIDVNAKTHEGWTPLIVACGSSNEDSSLEAVKLLLNHKDIDINACDNDGWTPLIIACRYADASSSPETVKCLLNDQTINVNMKTSDGISALSAISHLDSVNLEILESLLNKINIDVNITDHDGFTPLMAVCADIMHNDNNIDNSLAVKRLLECDNIDINAQSTNGYTALMYASSRANEEIAMKMVRYLLEKHDIDLTITNNFGESALNCSINKHNYIVAFMLAQRIDNCNTLTSISIATGALQSRSHRAIEYLINNKHLDINALFSNKQTLLIRACKNKFATMIKYLLNNSNINVNATDQFGNTALMYMCKYESSVFALVAGHENTNTNIKNNKGMTALLVACKYGIYNAVKYLVDHKKTDINAVNSKFNNAIVIALSHYNKHTPNIIRYLLQNKIIICDNAVKKIIRCKDLFLKLANDSYATNVFFNNAYLLGTFIKLYLTQRKIFANDMDILCIYNKFTIDNVIEVLPYITTNLKSQFETQIMMNTVLNRDIISDIFKLYMYYSNNIVSKICLHRLRILSNPQNILGLCDISSGAIDFMSADEILYNKNFDKLKFLFDTTKTNELLSKINSYLEYNALQ